MANTKYKTNIFLMEPVIIKVADENGCADDYDDYEEETEEGIRDTEDTYLSDILRQLLDSREDSSKYNIFTERYSIFAGILGDCDENAPLWDIENKKFAPADKIVFFIPIDKKDGVDMQNLYDTVCKDGLHDIFTFYWDRREHREGYKPKDCTKLIGLMSYNIYLADSVFNDEKEVNRYADAVEKYLSHKE